MKNAGAEREVLAAEDARPLVLHVVVRFDTGGLENGVVNLINAMPEHSYRHAVLALTTVSSFSDRVRRKGTRFIALNKKPGHGFKQFPAVWRVLKDLKPAVVHTRNLGPLEMQVVAAAAGTAARIHGEHGRDINDVDGSNKRLQWARRVYNPFVHRYVALSKDLQAYLTDKVGIKAARIEQIYNGVDTLRFSPPLPAMAKPVPGWPFALNGVWVVGTVGRMQTVKNPELLVRAFVRALALRPELKPIWRLVMVGDGPLRTALQSLLAKQGLAQQAWLPGDRSDVPHIMQNLHCFVLPSLAEGISNTILEAMATGLPVVATHVGGNAELLQSGRTGELVASNDVEDLAQRLLMMYAKPERALSMGAAARLEVERRFSIQSMVSAYQALYDQQLDPARALARAPSREH